MYRAPIESIQVKENRQRREFDPSAMADLADSISRIGLLHPIVVREEGAPGGDLNQLVLVAGERRLRACRELSFLGQGIRHAGQTLDPGWIPVVELGELSPVEALEAEYEENAIRSDLTWQERADAISKLQQLRETQSGQLVSPAAIANEILGRSDGGYQASVRKSLIVAQHLNSPDVAKAKTLDEAFKILKKKEQGEQMAALSAQVGATFSSREHQCLLGDALSIMETLPPGSFDIILSDPPYGMGADEFGDSGGEVQGGAHAYSDDEDTFFQTVGGAIPLLTRAAKPAAHLYLFCDIDKFHWLRQRVEDHGWTAFRTPLIMVKSASGRVPLPEHGPRRQYELILYAYRGKRTCTAIYPDVFTVAPDSNLGHSAQKPVEAYVNLLRRSARPGDTVLDPFAGTGTIFPAATQLQLRATGIELSPEFHGIAVTRLKELP